MKKLTAKEIKKIRTGKRLSQRDLAFRAGVDPAQICRIESGQTTNPQPQTLERIAAALGLADNAALESSTAAPAEQKGKAKAGKKGAKKTAVHVYTIVIRSPMGDEHILTTADPKAARRKYNELRAADRLPRVIMDGQDLPIYKADELLPMSPSDQYIRTQPRNRKASPTPAG